MLMTDNQIELEEHTVRRPQQNTEIGDRKSVFDRANKTSTGTTKL
jgi:hypothetical protein